MEDKIASRPSTIYHLPSSKSPLLVIVGETASGKSALAMYLAQKYNGEIICADSRTIYTGMDIGTAKPTEQEQLKVPHHLLDVISPDQKFSVAQFKTLALEKLAEITARRKLPILVGGTGLYIDAVIYDYQFSNTGSERDSKNPRHLKRTEINEKEHVLRANTLLLGKQIEATDLSQRITTRVGKMINDGLKNEVKKLSDRFGWDAEAMTGVGYREFREYFNGAETFEKTRELIVTHTRQYAKRQRTWFKRNNNIQWCTSTEQADEYVEHFLSKLLLQ